MSVHLGGLKKKVARMEVNPKANALLFLVAQGHGYGITSFSRSLQAQQ
jgi:hypothetical protein